MPHLDILARRRVIYTLIAIGILMLTILNFSAWVYIGNLRDQLIPHFRQEVLNTGKLYALQISEVLGFRELTDIQQDPVSAVMVERLLQDLKQQSQLRVLFLTDSSRTLILDDDFTSDDDSLLYSFPFDEPRFQSALGGTAAEPAAREENGQYLLTAYLPVRESITDAVLGVMVIDARERFGGQFDAIRQTLLYLGIGGVMLIALFASIIILSIRQLFESETQRHQQSRLAQLGQMAAMVAHEIRNPLSIIKGSAEVLRKKYAAEGDELLTFIPEEINRLNRLVNDFLQFSRQRQFDLQPVDPVDIIDAIVDQLGDGRITTRFEETSHQLRLDADAFRQVMLNIIENGRAALQENGRMQVRTALSGGRNRRLEIIISDDGAGMKPEVLERIYEPFFSTRATGSGLGMAITRQLVEQMYGTIDIDSKAQQGTTVRLRFPLA